MDNNLNNNTENNINGGNVQSSVVPGIVVNPQTITNTVPATNTVVNNTPSNILTTTNVATPVNATNVNNAVTNKNETQTYYRKFYIMMGIIVGGVLLIAVILLIFLLNGSIGNRNRLTCTNTTQEDDYVHTVERYYTFDKKVMQRVYYTHTFAYKDELTDDMYNQLYDDIINNENHGITKYGFATKISKEGNIVTITSYDINYYNDTLDTIKDTNSREGYTCVK